MDRHALSADFEKYWLLAHPNVVSKKEKQSQAQEEWRKKWKNAKAEEIKGRIGELKQAADEVKRKKEGKKMSQTSLKGFFGHTANLTPGTSSSSTSSSAQESPSQAAQSAETGGCGIPGPGEDSEEETVEVVGESSMGAGIGENDELDRKFPTPSQDRLQDISDGYAKRIARLVEMKNHGIVLSGAEKDQLRKWSVEKRRADKKILLRKADARRKKATRAKDKNALLDLKRRVPEVLEEVGLKIRERPGRPAIEDDPTLKFPSLKSPPPFLATALPSRIDIYWGQGPQTPAYMIQSSQQVCSAASRPPTRELGNE